MKQSFYNFLKIFSVEVSCVSALSRVGLRTGLLPSQEKSR